MKHIARKRFGQHFLSDDGIIEAVERADRRFCLGVQWHPERMPRSASSLALFAALIETAQG